MSVKMKPGDPAYWMLFDGIETKPTVYSPTCYICNDPEFAQMGLPLCYACPFCGGHVAADDSVCDECGRDADEYKRPESESDDSEQEAAKLTHDPSIPFPSHLLRDR